jgi:hypothetical protein
MLSKAIEFILAASVGQFVRINGSLSPFWVVFIYKMPLFYSVF